MHVIATEAAVGEGFLVTVRKSFILEVLETNRIAGVDESGSGFDLLANKGTCSHLLLTPSLYSITLAHEQTKSGVSFCSLLVVIGTLSGSIV